MSETVTARSKYLEVPQEMRNRIVKVHAESMAHKRRGKEQAVPLVEEIEYKGVSQELGMVGMSTDEVRGKVQGKLEHLEEIRDYVKEVTTRRGEQRKAYLSEIVKREVAYAEEHLAGLEEKVRALIGRGREGVLQSVQTAINRLSKKLENM